MVKREHLGPARPEPSREEIAVGGKRMVDCDAIEVRAAKTVVPSHIPCWSQLAATGALAQFSLIIMSPCLSSRVVWGLGVHREQQ